MAKPDASPVSYSGSGVRRLQYPLRADPFSRSRRFLAAIEAALERNEGSFAIAVLHGLRGAGKTTIAAAYAERHRSDYRAIWWVRAQTPEGMRADLAALGVRLGWVVVDEKEQRRSQGSWSVYVTRVPASC